jgi:hypothetical protein
LFQIIGSLLIVAALISLLFLWFHCLTLCMMYALFVIHLIYLFDVYCMLFQSIHCMRNLPTKCSYTPPS